MPGRLLLTYRGRSHFQTYSLATSIPALQSTSATISRRFEYFRLSCFAPCVRIIWIVFLFFLLIFYFSLAVFFLFFLFFLFFNFSSKKNLYKAKHIRHVSYEKVNRGMKKDKKCNDFAKVVTMKCAFSAFQRVLFRVANDVCWSCV